MKKIKNKSKIILKIILSIIFLIVLITIINFIKTPSNDRVWVDDFAILSYSEIKNNNITIYNIRNITYEKDEPYTIEYYNKSFDLNKIDKVYFMFEPFSAWSAVAHTFLTFEFSDDSYISLSVEARREKGESYSPLKGTLNLYEVIYLWADEKDNIGRRTVYQGYNIEMYPLNLSKEKEKKLFLELANYSNTLKENPKFYNTLTTTCTSELAKRANSVTPGKIKFTKATYLPGYSIEYLYNSNLIDTQIPFENLSQYYDITEISKEYYNSPEFYKKLREKIHRV